MAAEEFKKEQFALTSSRHFPEWLAAAGSALAFTTYQAGKLFLLGVKADGRLAIFERTFARSMGLGVSGDELEAEWFEGWVVGSGGRSNVNHGAGAG